MSGFDVAEFHAEAVRTPSHESVAEMRSLLVGALSDQWPDDAVGTEPSVDDAGNVLAVRGEGSPHLVLNTHIDTVPPDVPFEREGDVVRGRGACDAKGPLAALVAAFLRSEPAGTLTLAITPDEETSSAGAHALDLSSVDGRSLPPVDAYVVGEPTDLDVCTAARGRFEGSIRISGTAAHAAEPASGQNAIRAAAPVLQAMETFDEERGPGEHEQLGRPSLTATTIEGGEARNQVPAACTIGFDRRSVPPETADGFRAALEEHLYQWMPTGMDLSVTLTDRETPFLEAFATDPDHRIVDALQGAGAGEARHFGAATEAAYFADDAPTVVFGPGVLADDEGPVAHAEREYVHRSAVERAATILTDAVDGFD